MFRRNLIVVEMAVVVLLVACGTLQVGIERTATTQTGTATPMPLAPTATQTPSPLPPRAATPTPALTFELPPTDLCGEYLHLSLLQGKAEGEFVATSYRCHRATIDSTGKSPSRSPELAVHRGTPVHLRLAVAQRPTAIDVRLYPGAGVSASFLQWPEALPMRVEVVDRLQPQPDTQFQYLPQASPGPYSLVVKVTWGDDVEIFYAISFALEEATE